MSDRKACESCGVNIHRNFRLCVDCNENGIIWAAKQARRAEIEQAAISGYCANVEPVMVTNVLGSNVSVAVPDPDEDMIDRYKKAWSERFQGVPEQQPKADDPFMVDQPKW